VAKSRYRTLVKNKDHVKVLGKVLRFLDEAQRVDVSPVDLMRPGCLQKAIRAATPIDNCLPVSRKLIWEYASWLGQWSNGGNPFIAVDASIYPSERLINALQPTDRAGSRLLAVLAHEAGHELMSTGKRKFVRNMGYWLAAEEESLHSEATGWLFSGMLRAFVFADVGSSARPDQTVQVV
jgi:hypothetical protein